MSLRLALGTALLLASALPQRQRAELANCRAWQEEQKYVSTPRASHPPATRIGIMPVRYHDLVNTLAGLEKTRVAGVGLENGQYTVPADDLGLSLVVPYLAYELGLTIPGAFDLFFQTVIVVSLISGVLGLLTLTPVLWPRLVGIAALTLTSLLAYRIGDVYIMMAATPVALVPWILVAVRRRSLQFLIAVGALAGGLAAFSNLMRSQSGTSLLIFLSIAWLLSRKLSSGLRLAGLGTATLCFILVWTAFRNIIAKRDLFLRERTVNQLLLTYHHPFWHAVYVGLGYVKNDAVPQFVDEVAIAKVCSVDPRVHFVSPEYEHILENATLQLLRHRPGLIILNLLAKTVVVLGHALLFGNIGWLIFLHRRPVWAIDLAFLAAIAVNSLFGILVVPVRPYLLGLIAYSALFGAISFVLAFESGSQLRLKDAWQEYKALEIGEAFRRCLRIPSRLGRNYG